MVHPFRERRFAGGVVAILAAALFALPQPALAASAAAESPRPATLSLHAQAQLAAAATLPTARAATSAAQEPSSAGPDRSRWSFFKSPAGVAVMVGLAVGVGYALYSTQNDRITSPGKN
jgi:hypothetical protein